MKVLKYLFLMSVLMASGCADSKDADVIGIWQETNNPMGRLDFRSDHTGHAYWPDQSGKQDSSEMHWEILKGENKVSVITPPGPVNFRIEPDRLIAPNGVVLLRRK